MRVIQFVFVLLFLLFIVIIGSSMFLGYQCYASNDPDSMACFMVSNRNEVGVRLK